MKILLLIGLIALTIISIVYLVRNIKKENKNPLSYKMDDQEYWDYLNKD